MDQRAAAELVERHFAFEATDDVDGVLATMSADADHEVIGSPWGEIRGRERLRCFYRELFAALRGEGVEPLGRWHGDGFVVDDSLWTGEIGDGTCFGLPGRSGHATFRILHLFEVSNGLIHHERVWADTNAIARQLD
jgi:ketosteroid isomerase-like protein